MNAPPTDGNENVIDIYILSTSSALPSQITDQLEPQGYRLTFFSDGQDLIDTLRSGKPNLLICDTSSPDSDGYEVCRQIKADDYLWNIPVLILTGASDLGDLLNVLDSNADNFIAQPYDPPYLISLIEGMLTTPVQRQTPDQIKTQFKISHDDRIFVVTADRRKLLEFLLSSFEIAVNKSSELLQAQDEIQSLGLNVKKLEQARQENGRTITTANENLKARDQKIAELSSHIAEVESERTELAEQAETLSHDLDAEKNLRTTAEDEIRRITRERDEADADHQARSGELQQNLAMVSAELATVKQGLSSASDSLARETSLRTERESDLERVRAEKGQVEENYRALLSENEGLKTSLVSERSRAEAAEKEAGALLQAKTETEQDLNRKITVLSSTAERQEADIARLSNELEAERTRFSHQEDKLRLLYEEKEQNETALRSQLDAGKKSTAILQGSYDQALATLEAREGTIATLTASLAEVTANHTDAMANKEQAEILVQSLTSAVEDRDGEIKALKDRLTSESAEHENAIRLVRRDLEAANEHVRETTAGRDEAQNLAASLTRNLEAGESEIRTLQESLSAATRDLADAVAERDQAETQAKALSLSLEETRAAREKEQARARETEESLNAAVLERERALEDLRNAHDETQSGLASRSEDLTQAKRDLEGLIAQKATLEGNLGATLARIRELEQEVHAASSQKMQARQQIQSLSDELETIKAAFENERQVRNDVEDGLKTAGSARQDLEQEIRQLTQERKALQSELQAEQNLRKEAEEHARALGQEKDTLQKALKTTDAERKLLEDGRAAKIQKLKEDFETVLGLQKTLEEQVSSLTRDKIQAETKAANLAAEIDQARAALADEWEDHMTDHERLVAAQEERDTLEEALHPRTLPAAAGSGLPVAATPARALVVEEPVAAPVHHEPKPYVLSVEDLFEDDEPEAKTATVPEEEAPLELPEGSTEGSVVFADEENPAGEQSGEYPGDEEEADEEEQATPEENPDEGSASGPNVSFNRAQWLDLLKWAHHCEVLTHEQRMQIVRMGRLIQKGRNLTKKQEEQVMEIIVLVQRLGYRFP